MKKKEVVATVVAGSVAFGGLGICEVVNAANLCEAEWACKPDPHPLHNYPTNSIGPQFTVLSTSTAMPTTSIASWPRT